MATAYYRQGVEGGAATDLDGIAYADIADGDLAWVMEGNKAYLYQWDASNTDSQSIPTIILADDDAGDGAWILQQSPYDTGLGTMPSGLVMETFVGGNVSHGTDATNDLDVEIFSCMDSTNATPISSTATITKRADAAFVAGTGNGGMLNNGSYPFASGQLYVWVAMGNGVAGDGDIGFLDTTDIANIAARVSTAGFSYYKVFGFRHTLSGSAAWAKFTNNGPYLIGSVASENVITTGVTNSFSTVTHTDHVSDDYTAQIMYGARDGSASSVLYASDDGTNVPFVVGKSDTTTTDTDKDIWGSTASRKGGFFPYLSTRQFREKDGATIDLLLHGVKFKR